MAFSRSRLGLLSMLGAPLACAIAGACVPGAGPAFDRDLLDAGPPPVDTFGDDGGETREDAALGDAFAVTGLTPSHGAFAGGTRTRIDGRGFSSKLTVIIGGGQDGGSRIELAPENVLASDPTRAALVMPDHEPGFVDITVRDEVTKKERTLKNGYYYDPFTVTPNTGASSGGTNIIITPYPGFTKNWDNVNMNVDVGGKPCPPTSFITINSDQYECTTPAGTPGAKDIVIHPVDLDGKTLPDVQVRDAFTYSDAADGYRGGLSGGALSGRMRVIAFNSSTGLPIPGALVIINTDTKGAAKTGANGVVEVPNVQGNKATVTVAARCHSPVTYVDVPVDTLTVYLNSVLLQECLDGDPSIIPGGSGAKVGGFINGEVLFPGGSKEFERNNWTTVPSPTKPTERRAAYAFEASGSPNGVFTLPSADQAITPESDGVGGYKYQLLTFPGNITMYVIAGIEDRSVSPPTFVPYSMGIARGVSVPASGRVDAVDLKMDILFDHEVKFTANAPLPGPRGPDRLTASLALTLGAAGYAIIPRGTRTALLPAPNEISFVGVPALDHDIAGEQYVIGARAVTGASESAPLSVVSRVRTTITNGAVALGGFLDVPVLSVPGASPWDGKHITFSSSSNLADLSVLSITSRQGLITWTIVAPKGANDFDLPDLESVKSGKDAVGLRKGGPITITLSSARIDKFEYGRIRTGQLSQSAWNAYAFDIAHGIF